MSRFYNSLSDVQIAAGRPIARQRAAQAAAAARNAHRDNPATISRDALRRAVRTESDLAAVVETASEKLRQLRINLGAARDRAGRMDDLAYRTGSIQEAAAAIRAQIDGLPSLIMRAEAELDAAKRALATHQAAMATFAAAAEAPEVEDAPEDAEDDAEPQLEPIAPVARGRGRPPKVVAA